MGEVNLCEGGGRFAGGEEGRVCYIDRFDFECDLTCSLGCPNDRLVPGLAKGIEYQRYHQPCPQKDEKRNKSGWGSEPLYAW